MIYVIVDTNNWIYLANSKNPDTGNFEDGRHVKLYDALMEKINSDEIELLVCPVIEAEWHRNKVQAEELIKKYRNEAEGHKGVIDKMGKSLEEADRKSLQDLQGKHLAKIEAKIKENQDHILRIEELIQKSTKYTISQETKAFAADWAVEKKAPFIGDKKNSMADAYIFFGAVAHLKELAKVEMPWDDDATYEYPTSIFVSGNKGGFSSQENTDIIHPDLKPIADETKLNFFRSLPAALNFIQEQIAAKPPVFSEEELRQIEEDIDNVADEWYICDVCSPSEENEYTNLVFFSEPYEVKKEGGEFVDPNQLQIVFTDAPPPEPVASHKIMVRTGDCSRCGTTHLLCECGTVTPMYGNNESGFECEGCGINYTVRIIDEGKGAYHQEIVVT